MFLSTACQDRVERRVLHVRRRPEIHGESSSEPAQVLLRVTTQNRSQSKAGVLDGMVELSDSEGGQEKEGAMTVTLAKRRGGACDPATAGKKRRTSRAGAVLSDSDGEVAAENRPQMAGGLLEQSEGAVLSDRDGVG